MAIGNVAVGLAQVILPKVLSIVDSSVEDKDQKNKIKAQLEETLLDNESDINKHASQVLKAEIGGESWMQRNWRPSLMFVIMAILTNNYIVAPYVSAFGGDIPVLDFPPAMWGLLTVSVGGYLGSRGVEKLKNASSNLIGNGQLY